MAAAPVAHFDDDDDDRPDQGLHHVLNMVSEDALLQQKGRSAEPQLLLDDDDDDGGGGEDGDDGEDRPELRHGGGFRSTEDLVTDFDQKLSACFQSVDARTDSIAPVSVIAEDTLLEKDEIWSALTSNYGRVMPVDWKQTRTCSTSPSRFSLHIRPRKTDVTAELSDDEELREQLDMHTIIVSSLAEEPLFTAEQVIEEIEEMMQDSPDMETEHNPSQSDLSMLSVEVQRFCGDPVYEEQVRTMTVAELNERLEEAEANISRLSEELVQQLALRDELDFEKEVKNSFISALIDVQNRQKEHRESLKKKRKLKGGAGTSQGPTEKSFGSRFSIDGLSSVIQNSFRQTFGGGCSENQYVTTVIPYEKKGHPPSIEDLQILTKILHAMKDDSDKVPSLLTDYILKALVRAGPRTERFVTHDAHCCGVVVAPNWRAPPLCHRNLAQSVPSSPFSPVSCTASGVTAACSCPDSQ
ncbi:fasciculation and elongation protein zeta-2 [Mugil cephalus]|uniref:fasciculation and elongation protein zeta-2 n=1 Tax=Mugil cephalus TaxID=48193 RepID=UPI001FB7FEF4|nr:fasciculation and elongation protein zeta-2 [Mugil cephalus]